MKLSRFPEEVALCATASLLLVSCQKDEPLYNNGGNGITCPLAGNANQDYRPSASYPVHQKFYSSLYI